LLRPDDLDFRFERYFEYRFDSGKLQPAPAANHDEQRRASRTIEILDLNRVGACASRKRMVHFLRSIGAATPDDCAYRYLISLCREM
jgi:hypothetical protein